MGKSFLKRLSLLILLFTTSVVCRAQEVINTQRKEIGKYKQLSFLRYIKNMDTNYVISFQNLTYFHIVDLSFNYFTKDDLLDLSNAIEVLDKVKYVKGETNTVNLKNGFSIDKVKGLGMWVSITAKDMKYTNLPMNQALRLSKDILKVLNPSSPARQSL